MFLLGGGSKLFLLLKDLVEEGKTVETKCNGLIKVLSDFYSPKNYVLTERHDYFQDRRQHPDEEMSESITSLKDFTSKYMSSLTAEQYLTVWCVPACIGNEETQHITPCSQKERKAAILCMREKNNVSLLVLYIRFEAVSMLSSHILQL